MATGPRAAQVVPLGMEQRTLGASLAVNASAPFLQVAERSLVVFEGRWAGLCGLRMLESAGILEIHQSWSSLGWKIARMAEK